MASLSHARRQWRGLLIRNVRQQSTAADGLRVRTAVFSELASQALPADSNPCPARAGDCGFVVKCLFRTGNRCRGAVLTALKFHIRCGGQILTPSKMPIRCGCPAWTALRMSIRCGGQISTASKMPCGSGSTVRRASRKSFRSVHTLRLGHDPSPGSVWLRWSFWVRDRQKKQPRSHERGHFERLNPLNGWLRPAPVRAFLPRRGSPGAGGCAWDNAACAGSKEYERNEWEVLPGWKNGVEVDRDAAGAAVNAGDPWTAVVFVLSSSANVVEAPMTASARSTVWRT